MFGIHGGVEQQQGFCGVGVIVAGGEDSGEQAQVQVSPALVKLCWLEVPKSVDMPRGHRIGHRQRGAHAAAERPLPRWLERPAGSRAVWVPVVGVVPVMP